MTKQEEMNLQVLEAALYQQLRVVRSLRAAVRRGDWRAQIGLDHAADVYRQLEAEAKKQWATWLRDRKVTA